MTLSQLSMDIGMVYITPDNTESLEQVPTSYPSPIKSSPASQWLIEVTIPWWIKGTPFFSANTAGTRVVERPSGFVHWNCRSYYVGSTSIRTVTLWKDKSVASIFQPVIQKNRHQSNERHSRRTKSTAEQFTQERNEVTKSETLKDTQ